MWKDGRKIKVCKVCGKEGHTPFQCPIKKIQMLSKQTPKEFSKKKQSERSKLIHNLDKAISEYYRKEQSKDIGYNYCEICGKRLKYEDACIGHLTSRRFIGTRFLPQNFLIICRDCNRPGSKQKVILQKMETILRTKYDSFDKAQSLKNTKLSTHDIKLLLDTYNNLL